MRSRLALFAVFVALGLSCESPFELPTKGYLRVAVTTTGGDLDPDGYTLQIDLAPEVPFGLNQTLVIASLDTGTHHVELHGVAGNCTPDGGSSRTIRVPLADTASAAFAIGCVATGVEVAVATDGVDVDPDGYAVSVDGAPAVVIPVNGSVRITRLTPGTHTVNLGGAAANCPVAGTASRPVTLDTGEVEPVGFSITCLSTSGIVEAQAATTGIDLDSDGYTVQLDGGTPQAVAIGGSTRFSGVSGGDHQLTLGGAAGNCPVAGSNPRIVSVTTGVPKRDTVRTTFGVTCVAATARIEVTAATTGIDLDPDGYTIQIDGGAAQPLAVNGTIGVSVAGGDHSITLGGAAGNCPVGGSNPRTVTVTTGGATRDTARTTFQLTCGAATGRIEVSAATTGIDLDPDGYSVQVDGGSPQPLGVNGTVGFSAVAGGDHSITLSAAAGNCAVGGGNPRTVTVTTGGATRDTARTTFDVTCLAATASIEVTAATTGPDPDANGYVVRVDNQAPVSVPTNGIATINGLGAGNHSVLLDGVAGNCAIGGSNPRTLSVTTGGTTKDTARTTFTMTCAATTGSVTVTVATSGVDPDPDGYLVRVRAPGGETDAVVGANATATITGLLPGDYSVSLEGISQNCDPTSQNPLPVSVTVGQSAPLAFGVSCLEAPQLAFANWVDGNTDIYVMKSNGAGLTRLTTAPGDDIEPAWAPGGAKIAFRSQRDGNAAIYVMDASGANQVRLTTAGSDYHPAWSPDGTRIAFVSERDGNPEIYVMDANGTNQVRLTNSPALDADPAWSPDGQKIAFRSNRGASYAQIYVMNVDGTGVTRLTTEDLNDLQPTWSPDGAKIVFTRDWGCDYYGCYSDLIAMAANGSGMTPLTVNSSAREAAWSPDNRRIAFTFASCDYYTCYSQVQLMRIDGSDPTVLLGDYAFNPAWRR